MKTAIQWLVQLFNCLFSWRCSWWEISSNWWEIYSSWNICNSLDLAKFSVLSLYFSGIFVGPVMFLNSQKNYYPMPQILSVFSCSNYPYCEIMNFTVRKSKNIFWVTALNTSSSYTYHSNNTYGPFTAVTANEECSITVRSPVDCLDYNSDSWHGFKQLNRARPTDNWQARLGNPGGLWPSLPPKEAEFPLFRLHVNQKKKKNQQHCHFLSFLISYIDYIFM